MTLTAPCPMDIKKLLCFNIYMKKPYGYLFLLTALVLICACGNSRYGGNSAALYDSGNFAAAAAGAPGSMPAEPAARSGNSTETDITQTRKLIKTARIQLRVNNPEETEKPLMNLMEKYGGWTASTRINDNSRYYTIRVPAVFYDSMIAEIKNFGKILYHAESAEDVTLRYYDLESRLAVKLDLLETYRTYLAKAANIDEIMTVESRIADLQHEIDQTGTQFRNLANLVDYWTVNVDIQGPASANNGPGLGEKISGLFGSFTDVLSSGLVILIGIIIYGVPVVLITVLLFLLLFGRIGLLRKMWRIASGKK